MLIDSLNKTYKFLSHLYQKAILLVNIKLVITSLSLGFICFNIFINFDKLNQTQLSLKVVILLFIAYIVSIFSLVINAVAWKEIVIWLGNDKLENITIPLFLRTNLLKYLPGGIWHFIERFRILSNHISAEKAFASVLLEPFIMLSAALFLIPITDFKNIFSLFYFVPAFLLARRWRGALIMQLAAMKLLQFKKLAAGFTFEKKSFEYNYSESAYPFRSFVLEILFLFLKFISFWLCLNSFYEVNYTLLFNWASLFFLSWSFGLIVPSAPGGVGVFESLILLINKDPIPQESLILALLSYRMLLSISDVTIPMVLFVRKILAKKLIY